MSKHDTKKDTARVERRVTKQTIKKGIEPRRRVRGAGFEGYNGTRLEDHGANEPLVPPEEPTPET